MSEMTIGSLCSGYGGLDLAVEKFLGARTIWHAEYEAAPSKVLAAHWPGVPNLGDMTRVDWSSVKPTRIVCGGTSCQDLSGAGKRAGMTEGTRSNIWVEMRECIAATRPDIVIWENVRGAFSAYAASDVEHEQGLLGETYGPDRPALRALGRVLGDLSDLGYDTEWVGVRASDAGAPHARFRVFVLAYARRLHGRSWWATGPGEATSRRPPADDLGRGALPAHPGSCGRDGWSRAPRREEIERTATEGCRQDAPTDADHGPSDGERARTESRRGSASTAADAESFAWGVEDRGTGFAADARCFSGELGRGARDVAGTASSAEGSRDQRERDGDAIEHRSPVDWGQYAHAIQRWERELGRVAPAPTEPGAAKNDSRRLSARFEEWMMGLPDGWVTDPSIGLSWNEQVKALGNGVVPQQAFLALSILWARALKALEAAA